MFLWILSRVKTNTESYMSNNTEINEQNTTHEESQEMSSIIKLLKNNIDWNGYRKLCLSIGSELNDPQHRFVKSLFLEEGLSDLSNNTLVYVGDKMDGCDFIIPSLNNAKIEMKHVNCSLFSDKKSILRKDTKPITLLNSKGTNKHVNLPDSYSDYLLITEEKGAALISKNKLKSFVKSNGDSLTAKIPTSELILLFTPSDIKPSLTEVSNLNLKKEFSNWRSCMRNMIKNM